MCISVRKCDSSECKRKSYSCNLLIVYVTAHQTGHKAQLVYNLLELYNVRPS